MASYNAGVVGTLTHYCDSGGSFSETYSATVTWSESYDSDNVLTCYNFRYSWVHGSRENGGIYGCYCGSSTGSDCLSCYRGVSLAYKSDINDTGNVYINCYDTNGNTMADYDRTLCSGSIGGSIVLDPGQSKTVKPLLFKSCNSIPVNFTIRNSRSKPQPTPPTFSPSCTPNSTSYNSATFNGGLSWGYCNYGTSGRNSGYQITSGDGLSIIKSGTGSSVTISTLQPNTKYYASFSATNGCLESSANCSVVTLAGNTLTDPNPKSFDTAEVRIVPVVGGGEYQPTHTIQIAECGTSNWRTATTTTATVPEVVTITGLKEETCYQVRAITTTPAGSYTGNTLTISTPPKGICLAEFTVVEPGLDQESLKAYVDVCYNWVSYLVPADISVYYRVKDGYDPAWILGDQVTVNEDTGTRCFRIPDLFPNQVVYELLISTHTEQVDWNSETQEFTTPLLPEASSDNCETLFYMTEYLCASIKKIVNGGNMKVFANPYSLQLCEPGNESPTNLTLWSRYLRLAHAYLCILCDFMNLAHATEGQYLVGEIGWVTILNQIVEADMNTDGWKLATSGAIYNYIHEKLKSVWHYQGTVDVIVQNVADLENYPNAKSAIVKSENAIYDLGNGTWTKNTEIVPEDFGVFHINQDSTEAKAESGWYYWGGTWNNLDADLSDLEEQIKALEAESSKLVQNAEGESKKIAVVDKDFDFTNVCRGEDVIYFVTESQNEPEFTYYTVTFAEQDGTVIREEQVLAGGVVGVFTPQKQGYTFEGWTVNGEAFDDTLPITQDTTVYANWQINQVSVSFNLNGGTGNTPDAIVGDYGMTVTLPGDDGFEYEGKTFGGWAWQGVKWTNTTPVYNDIVLDAAWDSVMLTVAVRTQPDQPDQIIQIAYGNSLQPIPDPTREGYDFLGWFNEDGTPFDFNAPITENTVIVAGWAVSQVTVSFNAQTIPNNAETVENPEPQTVVRGGYATEPTVTATNWILDYWTLNGNRFNFDTPVEENITLEAVWVPAYEVVFDAAGGEPTPDTQRVPEGGYATKPEDPTKDGCEFEGWTEVQTHSVTFNPNIEGQAPTVVHVDDGEKVEEPETPVNPNEECEFLGWEEEE